MRVALSGGGLKARRLKERWLPENIFISLSMGSEPGKRSLSAGRKCIVFLFRALKIVNCYVIVSEE
jgi:hypothetical protein